MAKRSLLTEWWLAICLAVLAGCSEAVDAREVLAHLQQTPDFLDRQPEFVEMARQTEERMLRASQRLAVRETLGRASALLNDPLVPTLGTANGGLLILEFSDYQCPPCRTSWPALEGLLARDSNLRLLVLPLPVYGEASRLAMEAALAAHLQGRFSPMHQWLMTASAIHRGALFEQAPSMGIDPKKLLTDLMDPRFPALVERARRLAEALHINGVPALVVGDLLVRGGINDEVLDRAVTLARCLNPLVPGAREEASCLENPK